MTNPTRRATSPAAVAAIRAWSRADASARTARTASEKRAAAKRVARACDAFDDVIAPE